MRKWFIYSLGMVVTVSLHTSLFAQTKGTLNEIVNSYNNYSQYNLREKIYIHTDRSYYVCGNILWFKTYVVNAVNNEPLSVSKVVYIEILNSLHQPVLQCKVAIKKGSGSGSFNLPFSLQSGNYELRAYTNWMKNGTPDHYFSKIITIINTTKNLDHSLVENKTVYFANFFPEGGNLVNGLESVVAFKVNDNTGKGADFKGILVDQMQDTILDFQSSNFGMGRFSFTPQPNKNYTAIITLNDSSVIKKNMPGSYNNGYVMQLTDEGSKNIKIRVQAAHVIAQNLYLIAQNHQHIDFARTIHLENNQAIVMINKDSLAEGMSIITLFDEQREPISERLYFKRPLEKMMIEAKADKNTYGYRSKVNMDIATVNESGKSLKGDLSVSVYRLDSLQHPGQDNIFSYLWLSSDIQGYIQDPVYYFKNDNPKTNDDLTNLLLTQGWRTFDWKNVFLNKKPSFSFIPENYGHIITAKITNDMSGKPAANILVYLSVPGKRVQLYGCRSDNNGLVHFDMKDFYGIDQVVLQTNTSKDSIYHLEILSPYSENFSNYSLPALHVAEDQSDDLQAAYNDMQIENGFHQKDLENFQHLSIDTLPFFYKPSKTYLLDNYTRFTTMEEVMREYVAEVNVSRKEKKYHFLTLNAPGFALHDMQPSETIFYTDPLILLDGVPVFDVNKIIEYDPLKVQKLDVVTSKYHWGPIDADGIVSYTTYKGNLDGFTLNPHDLVVDYDGLQQQRIFYSPDYSTENAQQSRLPDFRDVLYWSPDINTSEKGDSKFSFFTGDVSGKYWVQLEGISSNGNAGSFGFMLNVAK